jgi:hypothetical protein
LAGEVVSFAGGVDTRTGGGSSIGDELGGQLKLSARPLGAGTVSPRVNTRVATGSPPAVARAGPVPSSSVGPPVDTVSGTTGPASGRPPGAGRVPVAGAAASGAGSATGSARLMLLR